MAIAINAGEKVIASDGVDAQNKKVHCKKFVSFGDSQHGVVT